MPTTVEYGMLAAPGRPSTSGVMALARKASVGRPPRGPSTCAATRSASGGSSSRRDTSRHAALAAGRSKTRPRSSIAGSSAARKASVASLPAARAGLAPSSDPATESSVLAIGSALRRSVCAVASDVTAKAPVTCVGRSENSPSPAAGSTSATSSRRLHDSAVRRPSGLSAGTSPTFVMRSTTGSPGRAPRLSASTLLITTLSAAGVWIAGTNPSDCRPSEASSVARAGPPARPPSVATSSDTSITIAGTSMSAAGAPAPAACDRQRAAVSSASCARKKPSDSTAAWMPPRRAIASRLSPRVSASPTPSAPAIVAATMPQAAANATRCGHHCRTSRKARPTIDRTEPTEAEGGGSAAVMARAAPRRDGGPCPRGRRPLLHGSRRPACHPTPRRVQRAVL